MKGKSPVPEQANGGNDSKKETFQGETEGLKGHIYDCIGVNQAPVMYEKTTQVIIEYVMRQVEDSRDTVKAMTNLQEPVLDDPIPPKGANPSEVEMIRWKIKLEEVTEQRKNNRIVGTQAYGIVWGQCTEAMKEKIKAHEEYEKAYEETNVISLLKAIKTEMFIFQTKKYTPLALYQAMKRLYTIRQGKNCSNHEYLGTFKNIVEVIEYGGGEIGNDAALLEMGNAPGTSGYTAKDYDVSKDKYLATIFITCADPSRYGKLIEDLENAFSRGDDKYPKDLKDAYNRLVTWKQDSNKPVLSVTSDATVRLAAPQEANSPTTRPPET